MPTRRYAILMLVLTAAVWGLSFPGGKALLLGANAALPGRDPWFFSSLMIGMRFGLAALVLWLFHPRAFAQMRASEFRQGFGLGVCGGVGMLFQADGLAFTEASTSAFLTQFTAVLVPIVIALRTRRWPSWFVTFCVALVVTGVGVLAQAPSPRAAIARAATAAIVANFMLIFPPPFRAGCPRERCQKMIR